MKRLRVDSFVLVASSCTIPSIQVVKARWVCPCVNIVGIIMGTTPGLHNYQISQRPPRTWAQTVNALLYFIVFNFACLMINGFQIAILLPLRLLPFKPARKLYDEGIRYSKGAFGTLLGVYRHPHLLAASKKLTCVSWLVLMCQWFAPTKLVVSFERMGQGRFSESELEGLVERDETGRVIMLNLPPKAVLLANHQVSEPMSYALNTI